MSAIWILIAVVHANAWLFPAPSDKHGWGLRIRLANTHRCYLSMESVDQDTFAILLINRDKDGQKHVTLKNPAMSVIWKAPSCGLVANLFPARWKTEVAFRAFRRRIWSLGGSHQRHSDSVTSATVNLKSRGNMNFGCH